jgi:hypothetical protein
MPTTETTTTQEIETKLALLEKTYRKRRKELNANNRAALHLYGSDGSETIKWYQACNALDTAYKSYARKLRALLAVLKEETNPQLQALMEDVMQKHAEQTAEQATKMETGNDA